MTDLDLRVVSEPQYFLTSWERRSRSILDEAKESMAQLSNRRWMVVDPNDVLMSALVEQAESGQMNNSSIQPPLVFRRLSGVDGKIYTFIEFFSVVRQPKPLRVIQGALT